MRTSNDSTGYGCKPPVPYVYLLGQSTAFLMEPTGAALRPSETRSRVARRIEPRIKECIKRDELAGSRTGGSRVVDLDIHERIHAFGNGGASSDKARREVRMPQGYFGRTCGSASSCASLMEEGVHNRLVARERALHRRPA